MKQINPAPRPQPPKPVDYPIYSQAEKDAALLSVCKFLLQHRKERLAKEAAERAGPHKPQADQ